MLCKRCLNLSGEYMKPIKPDTLQGISARSLSPGTGLPEATTGRAAAPATEADRSHAAYTGQFGMFLTM